MLDDSLQHIIFDLEATCWKKGSHLDRMEIIEIGAVRLQAPAFEPVHAFSTFVRPINEPILSEFCRNLTSIRQADVDSAPKFPSALTALLDWIGPGKTSLCSWGAYDLRQISADCRKHSIEVPAIFQNHIDLKAVFSQLYKHKPCGMRKALNLLGLPLECVHHRGIDDAKNISRIAQKVLPEYYQKENHGDDL